MTAQIIDGNKIAARFNAETRARVGARRAQGLPTPGLAVVLVGDDPASQVYIRRKQKTCEDVGIQAIEHLLAADTTQDALLQLIDKLNNDLAVNGILVQLPLPAHIDSAVVLDRIHPGKDVDGFHPCNMGRLAQGRPQLRPCTPYGVMQLLESTAVPLRGLEAVVIGTSNIVGRPMVLELIQAGCTVTVCNRATRDLPAQVSRADIVVSAAGQPGLVRGDWIKTGAIVIDVGINRLEDGSLTGDVDFGAASQRAAWITPVPGGVGPMTVAMLMKNTLDACEGGTD
jgi:methylenetetrahydrofolate dehydrogenase (NADP+)/methenyltetrahydrofolate cyclohydrolase